MPKRALEPRDAIERLNDTAHAIEATKSARANLARARSSLLLDLQPRSVFFARLAMNLEAVILPDAPFPVAATDGRRLALNPDGWNELTDAERVGVLVHEIMHLAQSHMVRRGARDPERWNIACDLSINPLVVSVGFSLPADGCFPDRPPFDSLGLEVGKSADWYYSRLEEHGQGQGQGSGPGAVLDAGTLGPKGESERPADGAAAEIEGRWKRDVAQARQLARQRGELPAGLDSLVDGILDPRRDWREELRDFVSVVGRNDYSWAHPNRRHVAAGLYLPSIRSEELGTIAVMLDESGSVDADLHRAFLSELAGILDALPARVVIVRHDSRVRDVEEWEPTDGPPVPRRRARGGTSHVPVFEFLANDPPDVAVGLTDLESSFPDEAPPYPVRWFAPEDHGEAPWGGTVAVVDA